MQRLQYIHRTDKGTWVFRWIAATKSDLLRTIGRMAGSKVAGFNWYDAAVVSNKINSIMPREASRPCRRTLN